MGLNLKIFQEMGLLTSACQWAYMDCLVVCNNDCNHLKNRCLWKNERHESILLDKADSAYNPAHDDAPGAPAQGASASCLVPCVKECSDMDVGRDAGWSLH
ncbi:MAG: hypothetical protein JWM11_7328 [Planctomycetaceae bacterium]|nr:hypothetical protein [Planctomycetaceae bacterium]